MLVAAPLVTLALLCTALAAHADAVRPGAAASLTLRAAAPHPVLRGDNQRTGRAPGFPAGLDPLWKFQIKGGVDLPAVAAGGVVVVASAAGQLVNLDAASGKELRRVALPGAPALGPLLTPRGDRVVITAGGEALGYTSSGGLRFRRSLPARPRDLRAAPLALASGGVVVAAGTALLWLDGEGRLQEQAQLPEAPVGALVESPQGVLAVTTGGRVFRWAPPEPPTQVGGLGGSPTSTAALAGRSLVASVDGSRVVFFDLFAGAVGVTVSSSAALVGPPSVGVGGEIWVTTAGGLLLALSPEGRELERASILGGGTEWDGAGDVMLVAEGGKVAFARPSGEVAVWSREGEISSEQRACGDPIGLISDGDRLIVTCRDGTVAAFGKKG